MPFTTLCHLPLPPIYHSLPSTIGKGKEKGPPKAKESQGEGTGPVLPIGYVPMQAGMPTSAEAIPQGLAAQLQADAAASGLVSHPLLGELPTGQGFLPLANLATNARLQQNYDIPQDGLPNLPNLSAPPWNQR